MQVAREAAGGKALMALTVDSPVSDSVTDAIKKEISADLVRSVSLVG
jgi:D-3-phosphoglycerate dehydrogenase